ncbi:hypothetical protein ALC60_05362 [Trachymyrmex zeteki]|uniref:Uncharacterized protein n=1 Tax=Mycetomoellerius zeteki TaxID=64791 RepID=A0A151X605_9HYME|nr:hypothetical protein ALC60_05362 [Trachymyrmex zeteki]
MKSTRSPVAYNHGLPGEGAGRIASIPQ